MSTKWLVIANGAQAHVFSYKGLFSSLEKVPEGNLEHINVPSRELTSTERGRVFHSADGSRSAMERTVDPHEFEKVLFAKEVAGFLKERSEQFTRLIIIAAPKTLGYLRKVIDGNVKGKIIIEIGKDYTNNRMTELPEILRGALIRNLWP